MKNKEIPKRLEDIYPLTIVHMRHGNLQSFGGVINLVDTLYGDIKFNLDDSSEYTHQPFSTFKILKNEEN